MERKPARGSDRNGKSRTVDLSKGMSYVLRHGAAKEGIAISSEGYVLVGDILKHKNFISKKYTVEEVKDVVENNDKKRFALKEEEGRLYIRANQGHTLEVKDLDLKKITTTNLVHYPVVVHGTTQRNWPAIKKTGLNRMKRNHIHFAKGEYGSADVISGMRATSEVMIYIDLPKAILDGIEFFESDNGVILSPGGKDGAIESKYFAHVLLSSTMKPFDKDFPQTRDN